jgi:hypothetical protein
MTAVDSTDPFLADALPPQPSPLAEEVLSAVKDPWRYYIDHRADGAAVVRYRTDLATSRASEQEALQDLVAAAEGLGRGADTWPDRRGSFVKLHAKPWSMADAFAEDGDSETDAVEAVEMANLMGRVA